ncbi:MAG: PA2779 family protein [Alphaproteobacteria bacterium]|uniref:PA2779 family protein n=1 Tax=Candidatus Nitrobium versatile TaxID=2884831 RepID=A0A953J9P2_9BACT|nr:PA2779 family protein [Candidatus Nitrobium versatile]
MKALKRYVAWYLVVAMFLIGIAPKSEAGFAPSGEIALAQVDRASDLQKVQSVLETKMVRDRLEKLGFTQEEIQSRLSRLSDQQIHELALNLDQIKAGGDGLGVVIAVLVIILLIIVILNLTGHRVLVR